MKTTVKRRLKYVVLALACVFVNLKTFSSPFIRTPERREPKGIKQ